MAFNPDRVIIGGGISNREDIVDRITFKVELYLDRHGAGDLNVSIVPCAFRSEANLLGAAVNFTETENS